MHFPSDISMVSDIKQTNHLSASKDPSSSVHSQSFYDSESFSESDKNNSGKLVYNEGNKIAPEQQDDKKKYDKFVESETAIDKFLCHQDRRPKIQLTRQPQNIITSGTTDQSPADINKETRTSLMLEKQDISKK